ncbi:MAG: transglycosylase SLT domain-containing protein [Bacteroidales bacterium]|nr:transglycosylase SLT domain-containing protein [Bacteroidales bacterium]
MKTTTLLLFLCLSSYAFASNPDTLIVEDDSSAMMFYEPDTVEFDESFDANVDSMLNLYYVQESLEGNLVPAETEKAIPVFDDDTYRSRIESIPSVAGLTYNNLVKRYIEVYTVKKRSQVEVMLGLSEHYFPIFDDIFDYYGVPNEMKYMSIIESALNPRAYSRARAVGLWQFMYGTGRIYGLEVNSLVDERNDPIKSTHAAAKFIGDLYNMYGDWLLALAAYNCGPGNVNKAIRRSGGKKNFWEIYYYLPRETRGHVPAFIAAAYTMNYFKEHNLEPANIDFPVITDTIIINNKLHLQQVSDVLNIPMKHLRDLNPQFRYDIVPGHIKPYALMLPDEHVLSFIDLQDSIFSYKDSVLLNPKLVNQPSHSTHVPDMPGSDYVKLTYTVKSGDAIGLIAQWYGVRLSDISYWNNIHKNRIQAGQKLAIYKHKNVADKFKDINTLSYAEKQARIGKTVSSANSTVTSASASDNNNSDAGFIIYTVRSGDTLWDIAKQYPGVSDTDIMHWNNITNAGSIKPGQKLKIKPRS